MKQKDLLLWVIVIVALAMSLIAIIGPRAIKSDAAVNNNCQRVYRRWSTAVAEGRVKDAEEWAFVYWSQGCGILSPQLIDSEQ